MCFGFPLRRQSSIFVSGSIRHLETICTPHRCWLRDFLFIYLFLPAVNAKQNVPKTQRDDFTTPGLAYNNLKTFSRCSSVRFRKRNSSIKRFQVLNCCNLSLTIQLLSLPVNYSGLWSYSYIDTSPTFLPFHKNLRFILNMNFIVRQLVSSIEKHRNESEQDGSKLGTYR